MKIFRIRAIERASRHPWGVTYYSSIGEAVAAYKRAAALPEPRTYGFILEHRRFFRCGKTRKRSGFEWYRYSLNTGRPRGRTTS